MSNSRTRSCHPRRRTVYLRARTPLIHLAERCREENLGKSCCSRSSLLSRLGTDPKFLSAAASQMKDVMAAVHMGIFSFCPLMRLDLQHIQNEVLNNARWLQWEAFIYKSAPHNVNSPGLWGFRRFAAASASIKASWRASRGANNQILFCTFRWLNTAYLADKDSCHSNVLGPCLQWTIQSGFHFKINFKVNFYLRNTVKCGRGLNIQWRLISGAYCSFLFLPDGHLIIPIYKGMETAWQSQRPHGCLYIWQMFSSDSLYFKGCGIQLVCSPPADGTVLHYSALFKPYLRNFFSSCNLTVSSKCDCLQIFNISKCTEISLWKRKTSGYW